MANTNSNKTLNVPNLRFPEFSGEWKKCTLNEVSSFIKEKINTDKLTTENYISTENMKSNFGGVETATSVPESTSVIRYQKGDVLLSNIRPYLRKVWAANRDGGCSTDVFVFRANKLFPPFLYYIMANDSFINYVMSGAKGVKMPRGDKEQMLKHDLSIPIPDEQYQISYFLSLLDSRIATQNKIIDKLQSLIKGLNDYIHDGIEGEYVCFSEFGEAYSGLNGKSGDDFGYGKPFVTYMNVYRNKYVSDNDYSLVQIAPSERQNRVRYGDALFTLSSETPDEVGIGAVYVGIDEELYLNSFCFGVHFNDHNQILPQYLAYLISSTHFRKSVFPLAQGSTRFNLQRNDFMQIRFILPPLKQQKSISKTLDCLSNRLKTESKLAKLYAEQKLYLLGQMFI